MWKASSVGVYLSYIALYDTRALRDRKPQRSTSNIFLWETAKSTNHSAENIFEACTQRY